MRTTAQIVIDLDESTKIEFGNIEPSRVAGAPVSKFVIASYNIRYAAGRYLISGGLLRKAGLGGDERRSREHVGRNIRTAAAAFSAGLLLPSVDILALQEADKETGRAG